jgi:hypothetical protein
MHGKDNIELLIESKMSLKNWRYRITFNYTAEQHYMHTLGRKQNMHVAGLSIKQMHVTGMHVVGLRLKQAYM